MPVTGSARMANVEQGAAISKRVLCRLRPAHKLFLEGPRIYNRRLTTLY